LDKLQEIKLHKLEETLGIKFNEIGLLERALTHRSFLNEARNVELQSNERLEFLGDAVLELITSEYLFNKYTDRPEGELTSFRAAVVRTESLAETSLKLMYSDYLYLSKGEEATGGRKRPYILANTYEAVLGAIYLDQGYETAKDFVTKTLLYKLEKIVEQRLDIDNKSKLQEYAQDSVKETPRYEVIKETGPDHDKEFTVAVIIRGKELGTGVGKSKQEAEQKAAQDALKNWPKQ